LPDHVVYFAKIFLKSVHAITLFSMPTVHNRNLNLNHDRNLNHNFSILGVFD